MLQFECDLNIQVCRLIPAVETGRKLTPYLCSRDWKETNQKEKCEKNKKEQASD